MKTPNLLVLLAAAAPLVLAAAPPAGFTEPPIVFYGTVTQTADGYTLPYTGGSLQWTITPSTGTAFQLRTALGALPGGMNYRLEIPVGKVPTGFRLAAGSIAASPTALTHQRGGITADGLPVSISSPVGPNAGTFAFAETQRGKTERVDLTVTAPFTDSDGDGLPDWWEDLYGLNKYDPSDAAQTDRFGTRSFLQDYQRQINPFLGSEYEQWAEARAIPAPQRPAGFDSDGDGTSNALEFALDTDPNKADAAASLAKRTVQIENIAGSNYLTMTVQKPGRQFVVYSVESSGDAQTWAGEENSGVVKLGETSTMLKVRDAVPAGTNGGKRFLRLRVILTQ